MSIVHRLECTSWPGHSVYIHPSIPSLRVSPASAFLLHLHMCTSRTTINPILASEMPRVVKIPDFVGGHMSQSLVLCLQAQKNDEKDGHTVYVGLSRLVKAALAMIPPTPPPIRQVAEATARLECCVMLLAWKVRTPGIQN